MGYIGKISVDGGTTEHPVASSLYGTCGTAAATAAKTVSCSDFTDFMTGLTIHVKFTYGNTATSPTLNVNGKGAKSIMAGGSTGFGASRPAWNAGEVVSFTYDGSAWHMVNYTGDSQPLPSGGSAGQVLAKASATDYDVEWVNQSGGGGESNYVVTTATIPTTGWSSNTITVSVSGVTSSNDVIVGPSPSSAAGWTSAGILCTAQGSGTLTFTRTSANSSALTANVLLLEGALDSANGVAF